MKKIKIYSLISLLVLLFTNCKPIQNITLPSLKKNPMGFGKKGIDSLNVGEISWKNYYNDTTLIALIDTALTSNLDLLMTYQRIEISRNYLNFVKNLALPSIVGSGGTGVNKFGKYTMNGAGNNGTQLTDSQTIPENLTNMYIGMQSSWEIDIWGKFKNKKMAAMARYLASIEGKNWLITNLVAEISANYYSLLSFDNELSIIKETSILQQNALEIIKIQKEAGVANELAVKQFEAQLLNSRSLEVGIIQQITLVENRINFLLGRFPQAIPRNKKYFLTNIPSQISVGIPSDLLKNRPDIKAAEQQLLASQADVRVAKTAFYPSLTIGAGVGFEAFSPQYIFNPLSLAYNILGGMAAPVINRRGIKAEFASANAMQLEALYNYQKSILNGYIEVNNELNNLKNLEQIQSLKSKEVEVLTNAVETSAALFRTGRATYLEILMTQKNALQARIELVNTKKQQFYSVINIYRALGGGWR